VDAINIFMVLVSSVTINPEIHTNMAIKPNNCPIGFSKNKETIPFRIEEISSIYM